MHVPSFRRKKKWKYNTTYKDNKQRESKKENKFRLKLKKVGKTTRPFKYDLNQIPYDYTVEVTNRFKGLYLINRVPDELWMEVHDIIQDIGIQNILKKKKCKKAKWLSEEALQIAGTRREAKSKGEKGKIFPSECRVPKNSKKRYENLPQ